MPPERHYYEWEIEKFLMVGQGWRVWYLVFPPEANLVVMRWVPIKRTDGCKSQEQKHTLEGARAIWLLLYRSGFRRVK